MVSLKYLSNFWKNLETLKNREINLILTWFVNCDILFTDVANQGALFSITDTKVYNPVVTLSTEDDAKLLQLLKSGFKGAINCNEYQSKVTAPMANQYLDY